MRDKPAVAVGVFGVGAVLGALGMYVGMTLSAPPPAPSAEAKPAAKAPVAAPCPDNPSAPKPAGDADPAGAKKAATCEATLDRLKSAYRSANQAKEDDEAIIEMLEELVKKSGADTPDGNPMTEWPESVTAQYRPEGFEEALETLKRECPEHFKEGGAKADCSEFPCVIALTAREDSRDWDGHSACPAFKRLFPGGTNTSGTTFDGVDGAKYHSMHVMPIPDDPETRAYLEEFGGNLAKRRKARHRDFNAAEQTRVFGDACASDGDPGACYQLGRAQRKTDPDAASAAMRRGCDGGHGTACNDLAWWRCHDEGACDEQALGDAKQATEANPNDGKGAWDTYAYVLCKRGDVAAANQAYARSCAEGYAANCGKTCS